MSFEDVYRKYLTKMYTYFLFKLGGNAYQAEDLASELFYLVFKKWDELCTFEEPRLIAWLYNAALTLVKQYWRESNSSVLNSVTLDVHTSSSIDIADTNDCFWIQLQNEDEKFRCYLEQLKQYLSEPELQVFVCRFEKNMSVLETAQKLEMSPNNVMVRTYRIRHKLRPIVEAMLHEDNC